MRQKRYSGSKTIPKGGKNKLLKDSRKTKSNTTHAHNQHGRPAGNND